MNALRADRQQSQHYFEELSRMVNADGYPCVGAKAVVARHQLSTFTASDIRDPQDDRAMQTFSWFY